MITRLYPAEQVKNGYSNGSSGAARKLDPAAHSLGDRDQPTPKATPAPTPPSAPAPLSAWSRPQPQATRPRAQKSKPMKAPSPLEVRPHGFDSQPPRHLQQRYSGGAPAAPRGPPPTSRGGGGGNGGGAWSASMPARQGWSSHDSSAPRGSRSAPRGSGGSSNGGNGGWSSVPARQGSGVSSTASAAKRQDTGSDNLAMKGSGQKPPESARGAEKPAAVLIPACKSPACSGGAQKNRPWCALSAHVSPPLQRCLTLLYLCSC